VKRLFLHRSVVISILILGSNFLVAHCFSGTSGGKYDMSILMNKPHPFAKIKSSPRLMPSNQNNNRVKEIYSNPPTQPKLFKIKSPFNTSDLNEIKIHDKSSASSQPFTSYRIYKNRLKSKNTKSDVTYSNSKVSAKLVRTPSDLKITEKSKSQKNVSNRLQPYTSYKMIKNQLESNLITSQGTDTSKNIFSEIRIGALWHDQGPFSHRKEKGFDGNLEILFISPDLLDSIKAPRPHVGVSINSAGDTNQAYLGLTWEYDFKQNYFANFSLGAGYHDGYKETPLLDRKSLGCKLLFRESLNVGYRLNKVHSIMAHLDHISNAKLCSTNEGLESVGFRYGYHF
jgi:lipid A 3-O-deacylase